MKRIVIQTSFEGFHVNDLDGARTTAARYGLTIPVGHSGSRKTPSSFMRRYPTGGTPWVAILDPEGAVHYNIFHTSPEQAVALIHGLRAKDRSDARD